MYWGNESLGRKYPPGKGEECANFRGKMEDCWLGTKQTNRTWGDGNLGENEERRPSCPGNFYWKKTNLGRGKGGIVRRWKGMGCVMLALGPLPFDCPIGGWKWRRAAGGKRIENGIQGEDWLMDWPATFCGFGEQPSNCGGARFGGGCCNAKRSELARRTTKMAGKLPQQNNGLKLGQSTVCAEHSARKFTPFFAGHFGGIYASRAKRAEIVVARFRWWGGHPPPKNGPFNQINSQFIQWSMLFTICCASSSSPSR
jgi:hypothetical protein